MLSPAIPPRPVAVGIPCYNEALALPSVLAEWREHLPDADLVVFDNDSTDDSAAIALQAGATVVRVPDRGKGHVVRRLLQHLADRPAIVMIDGDGTYPASAVGPLLGAVLSGRADMSVGARRPVDDPGAMSPVRGLGNVLINTAFRVLIGRGTDDLLSGYRVFSPRFAREVRLRSTGFEIETELASEAVARRLPTFESPVPYRRRIEGTQSKLNAARDGLRILNTIIRQSVRLRPERPAGLAASLAAVASAIAGRPHLAYAAGAVCLVAAVAVVLRSTFPPTVRATPDS